MPMERIQLFVCMNWDFIYSSFWYLLFRFFFRLVLTHVYWFHVLQLIIIILLLIILSTVFKWFQIVDLLLIQLNLVTVIIYNGHQLVLFLLNHFDGIVLFFDNDWVESFVTISSRSGFSCTNSGSNRYRIEILLSLFNIFQSGRFDRYLWKNICEFPFGTVVVFAS